MATQTPPVPTIPRDNAAALTNTAMCFDFSAGSRNEVRAARLYEIQQKNINGNKGRDLRLRFVSRVRDVVSDYYPDIPASAMTVTVSTVDDAVKVLEIYEAILTRIAAEGLDPIWKRVTGR